MMINFDGYKINTNEMFFLCLGDTAQRIKNKDYTELLENTFFVLKDKDSNSYYISQSSL